MSGQSALGYTIHDFTRAVLRNAEVTGSNDIPYPDFLEYIRKQVQKNHSSELADVIGNAEASDVLKTIIAKYITLSPRLPTGYEMDQLINRIYQSMAGLDFLEDYLNDSTVEEINYNGFKAGVLEVRRRSGVEFPNVKFPSAEAALNVAKKMVRMGGEQLDYSNALTDSYLENGTRVSATCYPAARKSDLVTFSIRAQNRKNITREELIAGGDMIEEIINFDVFCATNGISMGFVGGTGSGKTTYMTFLINEFIRHNKKPNSRVYIGDDTCEVEVIEWDDLHNRPACVVYNTTKKPPNPITMRDLIKEAMRQHPALIVPTECRDDAAYDIADAGNTGHTILTGFHGNDAISGYQRFFSMCQQAKPNQSEDTLMRYIITAIPIMKYRQTIEDNTIKDMQIFEATGYKNGELEGKLLFRYVKDKFDFDQNGYVTKVHGHYEKVNNISKRLREKLESGGSEVKHFLEKVFPLEEEK